MKKLDDLVTQLDGLEKQELQNLGQLIQERWGVGEQPVMVFWPFKYPAYSGTAEEKTEFTVNLDGYTREARIGVLKVVRRVTGLGLRESQQLIECCPARIVEGWNWDDARKLKAELEELGCLVSIS